MKERISKAKDTQLHLSSLCTCAQDFIAQQSAVGLSTMGVVAGPSTIQSVYQQAQRSSQQPSVMGTHGA